ncbi:putative PIG3 family NAD(P)H quinone oxidoreductase [Flavimobilis soli]|uniref:Putative PIG3 family NAD(P)H quinone oxidoreductase n=1 Tax=Flavimobilis soli TaxID=442709 RepID=A0A2A9EES5_9MICO|nr:putative PIG3 family NAD(P)H quinone oxidoreductase [Flavimobilis soli]
MRIITADPPDSEARVPLVVRDSPDPGLLDDGVVVAVEAAGVNPADLLQVAGKYPPPPGAPSWPGLEVAGRIVATGPLVRGWEVGQRVAALLAGGGYAELAAVPASQLLPVPDALSDVAAAALPEALATAWSNLVDVGGMQQDDVVLVHGGTGGVGSVAAQLAVARGARVVAVAGGAERAERLRELLARVPGSHEAVVVDRTSEDFVSACQDLGGADVVLDVVGAANLGRNVESLATGGRLVVIGLPRGRKGELDLGALLAKRASVHGTTLRARPAEEKAAIMAAVREEAWPLVVDGTITPVVHATFPFEEAQQAHDTVRAGSPFGKVVLVRHG